LVSDAWPDSKSDWKECGQIGCFAFGLVVVEKGQPRVAQSHADLRSVLGAIDTPSEAVVWAQAHGQRATCTDPIKKVGDAYHIETKQMIKDCPIQYAEIALEVSASGEVKETRRKELPETGMCVGRRPEQLESCGRSDTGYVLGDYFAELASLEAAAVVAFERLQDELAEHGAPADLIERAEEAAQDELRHTDAMGRLAAEHGAVAVRPKIANRQRRTFFDFARENLIEGCVRETFGAAMALYQAAKAAAPSVRAALRTIAEEEARHAELSLDVHEWALTKLSAAQRVELDFDARAAIRTLRSQLREAPQELIQVTAGVPAPHVAAQLMDHLDSELWRSSVLGGLDSARA
jgi:hypothetical protein